MNRVRVLLVQLPAPARDVARAAAQASFPGAEIIEVGASEVPARRDEAPVGPELLVLADAAAAAVLPAAAPLEANELARWAVVILGRGPADQVDTVPPEEWSAPHLARVFRSALRQHELLVENLRLRGDLMTVARRLRHDLTTPVACISTGCSVLKVLPATDTHAIAGIIQNIDDSSAEILELIERVSFVLRASADPGVRGELEMGDVVAAALNQLDAEVRKAAATVVQPSSWPRVTGVQSWLQVIWWNLLGNALKHGGLGIQIRLGWNREGEVHRFSVADSGAGVAAAAQDGLFRPFDQLHSRHTQGLGLSIVQRLVALQGGRCGYDKDPAGGASFHFTLPAAKS